jgi:uncharacterized protein (TIGR03000 family)
MMKRTLFACTALGMLALLLLPDMANAQRRGGGWRGGESSWGGGGWGGSGWGGEWGRGGFGYGYPGYYGGYGNRWYGGYGYPAYGSYYGNYDSGYQPSYSYDYGSQPYYSYDSGSQPYSSDQGAYDYAYTDQGSSDGSNTGRSNNTVSLRVILPAPDAKVWVEGQETRQKGNDRLFISPPLERGKSYNYTVKAEWNQDGRQVTREKTVPVQAGRQAMVNFGQGGNMDQRRMRTGTQIDQTEEFDRTRDNRRQFDNQSNRPHDNRDLEHPNASDRTRTDAHRQFDASHPFTGKVVSMNDDQVTVSDAQGKEHTFRIPASANVMVQGSKGSASSLKPGMQVTITPESDNMGVASKIEANSQDRDQGNTQNRGNAKPPTNRPPE